MMGLAAQGRAEVFGVGDEGRAEEKTDGCFFVLLIGRNIG
jgi:hypothetical protein